MKRIKRSSLLVFVIILIIVLFLLNNGGPSINNHFDSSKAFQYIQNQLSFGPRIPESTGHQQTINWLTYNLKQFGWEITLQTFSYRQMQLTNIIAEKGDGKNWIVIAAHYDTRRYSDQDPQFENHSQPVPGADDGASGVAILLELGRILPINSNTKISLVFFDGEDQGNINSWDWSIGSVYYVGKLIEKPKEAIVLDMVGQTDLALYKENFSNVELTNEIWETAAKLGYEKYFIQQNKYSMIDDHLPFIKHGIPAALIIDFDYPYWHTVNDTQDKLSERSLKIVGDTILEWIYQQ